MYIKALKLQKDVPQVEIRALKIKRQAYLDFSNILNFIKKHEIKLLALVGFCLIFWLDLAINSLWQHPSYSLTSLDKIQQIFEILWIIPLPLALVTFLGMLFYIKGVHLKKIPPKVNGSTIYFRLVTKGQNRKTILSTVFNIISVLNRMSVKYQKDIPYILEIVTEKNIPILKTIFRKNQFKNLRVIEVSDSFETKNNTLYKARGLHYAILKSKAKDNDWIFHIDEESQIDEDTVKGILEFIDDEEEKIEKDPSYKAKIGQGTILYHRNLLKNPFYTLADFLRTGDDVGRFYLQNALEVCLFGMHGSFVLVRNSIEKKEGFDLTSQNCVTEDAYWGLRAMQKGYKFGHIFGFLHEQSPQKAADFIKQRRRWFVGLTKVLSSKDLKFKTKLPLLLSVIFWTFSPFVFLYTIFNIIHPVPTPTLIGILGSFTFSIYIFVYLVGFYINISYIKLPVYRKVLFSIAQVLFIPVYSILESSGVLYGLINRNVDFHVISK